MDGTYTNIIDYVAEPDITSVEDLAPAHAAIWLDDGCRETLPELALAVAKNAGE